MGPNDNYFDYFVLCMRAIVGNTLRNYTKIASYGPQTIIDSEHPTKIMDVFTIRFRDGNIVELVPDPISKAVETYFTLVDNSFPDGVGFSIHFNYDMIVLPPPPCFNDDHIWPKGTWLYELADTTIMLLNWGEAGRLSELISSLKDKGGTVAEFPITPPAEQPKPVVKAFVF